MGLHNIMMDALAAKSLLEGPSLPKAAEQWTERQAEVERIKSLFEELCQAVVSLEVALPDLTKAAQTADKDARNATSLLNAETAESFGEMTEIAKHASTADASARVLASEHNWNTLNQGLSSVEEVLKSFSTAAEIGPEKAQAASNLTPPLVERIDHFIDALRP